MALLEEQEKMPEQMEELQELLEQLWPEVRRRHLFPEIPMPRFDRTL